MSEFVLYTAFGLYCLNLLVGVIAQLGWFHFGKAHHVLYFFVFAAAILTMVINVHPALLLTLGALALMPKSKPWTWKHPLCAGLGFVGYLIVLMTH